MDVRMPDGTIVRNVPEGTTKEEIMAKLGPRSNKLLGSVRSGLEGATLGFADELGLGLAAAAAKMTEGGDFSDIYKKMRETYNREQGQFAKENPALAIGSTIAGGLLTAPLTAGGAAAQAIKAKSLIPLAKQGALLGGVSGAGFAPTMEDVPLGAGLGAATGWATPYALQGAMKGVKGTVGAAKGLLGLPGKLLQNVDDAAQQSAAKQIGQAFQRDQIPIPQALSQAQALGPEGVMADVGGENVRRLLQTAASQPGQTAQLAEKTLQSRMDRSVPRILNALKESFGTDVSVYRTTSDLLGKAAKEAGPLYRKADPQIVSAEKMQGLLSDLKERVYYAQGTDIGGQLRSVLNSLVKKNTPGVKGPFPKLTIKELQWAKRSLDGKIGRAISKNDGPLSSQLMDIKGKLLDIMDTVPEYQQARQIYSSDYSVKSAVELGTKILTADVSKMSDELTGLSKADFSGYLIGAREAIANTIKGAQEGSNAARRVATYAVKERLSQAFPSQEALDKFMKALDVEDTFAQLRNVTTRGSQTQQRISNEALVGLSAASDAAQGRFISVVMGKVAQFLNNYKSIPEPVRDEIGKMLLSDFSKTGQVSTKLLQKMAKHQIREDQIKQLITTVNASTSPAVIMGEQKAMQ